MSSSSETGHAKNVANLNTLIASCEVNAERYKPSNKLLGMDQLKALLKNVNDSLAEHKLAKQAFDNATTNRKNLFKSLPALATRVFNSAASSGMSKQAISGISSINRKLQGKRATPKLTDEQKTQMKAEGREKKEISSSQHSFDNQIDFFDMLIKAVSSHPEYQPNEPEIQIESLTQYFNTLKEKKQEVISTETVFAKARINRNKYMYTPETGLVDVALTVKKYIKSVDKVTGPWYKQISGLQFKRIPN